jgi:hypothetical protein
MNGVNRGTRAIGSEREVTMKARYYRIVGSAAVMTALIAVLAAPKKWG